MDTIAINSSNTTKNSNNINKKNLHEISPEFQILATLKANFYC